MSSLQYITAEGNAPAEEQAVCIRCGLCCDGTLFAYAVLNAGERENLPEKLEEQSYTEGGKDYFSLPCQYFSGKCTIYNLKRADVCSSYRCQLLKDQAEGKITHDAALSLVHEAMAMRHEILEQYRSISGDREKIFFKQLLVRLGKLREAQDEESQASSIYDLLIARCNIFETLLIKYFRSEEDFEKMIMR